MMELIEKGCVLFRSQLKDALDQGIPAQEVAATIIDQFVDLANFDPGIDDWTMKVLTELAKDPEPLRSFVWAVCTAVREQLNPGIEVREIQK
jgi:hypothetical protein